MVAMKRKVLNSRNL